jgi:hypothetical protein
MRALAAPVYDAAVRREMRSRILVLFLRSSDLELETFRGDD